MDAVLARIEALSGDAVTLLRELGRTNSVDPAFAGVRREEVIGGETRVNEFRRERYEQAGLETRWVAEDPERRNIVGVRSGKGGGPSLALNGHVETVPPVDPELSSWRSRSRRRWPAAPTPWEAPVVQTVRRAHERVTGTAVPEPSPQHPVGFGAASDASFYESAGIPAVVFGPGDISLAHCKDESVEIDEVIAAGRSLAVAVMEWCEIA